MRNAECGMRNGSDRLRALNVQQQVSVELDARGTPTIVKRETGNEKRIESIGETWRIDDEWWRADGVVRGLDDGRVVRSEADLARNAGIRNRTRSINSALRIPHSAIYVYRAPLPLGLLVSRRRLSPRAAGAHRIAARLPRARPHRPQRAVRLDGVRARIAEARPAG